MNRSGFKHEDEIAVSSAGLKIGEVSRLSGVGIETIRFYERGGLLDRPARTYSGYRIYDGSVLERLDFIRKAQLLGFALQEIRELIDHKRKGENPCADVRSVVRSRLTELNARIEQMLAYRDELASALEDWEEKGETEGHVCGLIEGTEIEHGIDRSRHLIK
ncbi:MAG: heavy metal-responsive transcriptional regulator [Blastocatellia bacterium]|nr:heavy metal-responsive transcriptional regulator [Chloracidobacterium sp.]MBL8184507.1 heavy metal-responsive transcriptional regulator [Blastocatellia bacterium]HBE82753.1 hypothetical protein [Blastocatellia bacterium]HRJ87668.1 heavy metal-responsive transcriptional regulator [Pyrinomonadaceae bacterium]HRK51969.1 heavy metal-responsive transcriptional regulator [Pyrinomonadaceae bacterium]